jgi:hypothetical protein
MGRIVRVLLVVVGLAGCAGLGPQPIDVAPGQRVVLGRVDLSRLDVTDGIVDVVRQDGGFNRELRVGRDGNEFAVGLPPGRYRFIQFRGTKDGRTLSDQFILHLNVGFDVGDAPAIYIGTLRLTTGFGSRAQATVLDEMEGTLRMLRSRYSDLPTAPTRALMTPG